MDQNTQHQVLHYAVSAAWMELYERRPRCLWLHLHEPVAAFVDGLSTPLLAVWFLDARGMHPQTPWEFVRFWVMQRDQPWCGRMYGEPSRVFGNPHDIGVVGFAQYQTTGDVYLEAEWGGCNGRSVVLTLGSRSAPGAS